MQLKALLSKFITIRFGGSENWNGPVEDDGSVQENAHG